MKKVLLGDVVDIIKGISYRSSEYSSSDDGVAFINLKSVARGGGYNPDGVKYYAGQIKANQYVEAGDILIANTDLTQNSEIIGSPIIMPNIDRKACFSLDLSKIVIKKPDVIYPKYLFYYLKSPLAREFMLAHSNGSTVMHLSIKSVPNMEIKIPSIEKQKKIADILDTLDEKIELNRRMNETLEQIGQALFRHYFIDNPDVKNWKIGTIDDLGDITTGKTPSKKIHEYFGKDMPFLKVPDMHNKSVVIDTDDGLSNLGVESQKNKTITKYSTCVSCIATVGVVSLSGVDLQTNQQINSIIPRQSRYRFYNYYAMSRKSDHIKTLASSGSATPNLNRGQFAKIPVVLPPDEVLKKFDKRLESVFEQIIENTYQIGGLIKIRDLLLPKLISGDIEI